MVHRTITLQVGGQPVQVDVELEASEDLAAYGFPAEREVYVFSWPDGPTGDIPTSRSVILRAMATWLAPIRLSRKTDASLNPEGQRARISDYADEHGDTVIWADVDMDVSGAVPIRERAGLGPWLAPDRIGQYDGFLADEMDRLSRNMLDYLQFAQDMAAMGKIIIDVSDGTDTSTERGRQQLEDRILAAQRERERMASRRRKAHSRARTAGRWDGGVVPFGYEPRCLCHGERQCPEPVAKKRQGWQLVQDPERAAIVRWMIRLRIAGRGFDAIAAQLTAKGIPTSRGKDEWKGTAVRKILTSPVLLGQLTVMVNGAQVVRRDKDGQPVTFTDEPLTDPDTWGLLQDAIQAGSRARGQAQSRHLLYRVLYCRQCSPRPLDPATAVRMYGNRRHTGAGQARHTRDHREYYNCKSCGLNIRLDKAEPYVEALVLAEAGDRVLMEKYTIHGDDHAVAISRAERAAERRRELLAEEPGDEDLRRSLAALEAQIATLKGKPHEPDRTGWRKVPGGITVAAHWAGLDTAGRAKFLRDWEVSCFADRDGTRTYLGWLRIYGEAFRLDGEGRLCPAALPALITHAREWQAVPGAVLPSRVASALPGGVDDQAAD